MKTLIRTAILFAAVHLLLIIPAARSENAGEPDLLERALRGMALKKSDVAMRTDLFDSPFALTLFRRWMGQPLKAPMEAQKKAAALLDSAEHPGLLLKKMAVLGDLEGLEPLPLQSCPSPNMPERIPEPLKEALGLILDAIFTANLTLSHSMECLPREDRDRLDRHLLSESCRPGSEENAGEDEGKRDLRQMIALSGRMDRRVVVRAALTLLQAVEEGRRILDKTLKRPDAWRPCAFQTSVGRVLIGGYGADTHTGPAVLILDPAGDDVYRGEVAFGRDGEASMVLDFAGDDVYLGKNHTQGAGHWGVGLLFDLAGDDLYMAGNCAQGAGHFGIGLLVDERGRDRYVGETFVQGASAWGAGGLIDLGGEDAYQCHGFGQGYAGVRGISLLCDTLGNDTYLSGVDAPDPREPDMNQSLSQGFAMGMRNLAAGGLAFLLDRHGNDLYRCQYFGQGAAYWMGIGLLYDETGRDTYSARRYAQGAGIHHALGLFLDAAGNDHTVSWGVSQGCGHDFGIGILLNETGNDTYVSDWLSMGASEAGGIGLFVDNKGADGYENRQGMAVGRLAERRRMAGMGVFLDAGGRDRYAEHGLNNGRWGPNRWAAGLDGETGGKSGLNLTPPEKAPKRREEARQARGRERRDLLKRLQDATLLDRAQRVEALMAVASHWGLETEIPEKTRTTLLQMDPEISVPAVARLLHTPNTLTLIFMDRFFKTHAFYALRALAEKVNDPDPVVRARVLYYLGELRDTALLRVFETALEDPAWRIRSRAYRALGEMLDKGRLKGLLPMKAALDRAEAENKPGPILRFLSRGHALETLSVVGRAMPLEYTMQAAWANRKARDPDQPDLKALAALIHGHLDRIAPRLDRWIQDIQTSGPVAEGLLPGLDDPDPEVVRAAAYALARMDYRPAIGGIGTCLHHPHRWVRDTAVLALALYGNDAVVFLEKAMKGQPPAFKILALDALSMIGTPAAKGLMKAYAHDPDPRVRKAARQGPWE